MKGSEEKQNPSDVQCDYCNRWFSNRGIFAHQQYCDEKTEQLKTMSENTQEETAEETSEENKQEKEETEGFEICPDCGNHGDGNEPHIYVTDGGLKNWLKQNRLWQSNQEMFYENEYLCFGCKTFFNKGEM